MLFNIPQIITPQIMKSIMEMGHGDQIILVDANYPACSNNYNVVQLPGVDIVDLLDAILTFLPVDDFVDNPIGLMKHRVEEKRPEIWDQFEDIVNRRVPHFSEFQMLERFEFYEQSKNAYIIIQTGTTARYANIILQKGVI